MLYYFTQSESISQIARVDIRSQEEGNSHENLELEHDTHIRLRILSVGIVMSQGQIIRKLVRTSCFRRYCRVDVALLVALVSAAGITAD